MNQRTGRPISRSGEDVVSGLWAEDDLSSPGVSTTPERCTATPRLRTTLAMLPQLSGSRLEVSSNQQLVVTSMPPDGADENGKTLLNVVMSGAACPGQLGDSLFEMDGRDELVDGSAGQVFVSEKLAGVTRHGTRSARYYVCCKSGAVTK
ncbi:uncharacterized protein LW93_8407 [Fusarium fujikuroi]|nr:uncharacterized protein LW93_8407 [Fusarium fujikuroi]